MTNLNKTEIQKAIERKISIVNSQNKVAKQLGISPAHLKSVREGDFRKVSDTMLNKLAQQLNLNLFAHWQKAETRNFLRVQNICKHTQQQGLSRAISFAPGSGKTFALKDYAERTKNVFYVECEEYWSKKVFLRELRKVIGLDDTSMGIADMVEGIIEQLGRADHPLVIIDEADKLKDGVLNLYKTFYNKTSAGFILAGTPHFRHRVEKGVRLNRMGFAEIHSRLGGEFLRLYPIANSDIESVCKANGVDDHAQIQHVIDTIQRDFRQIKAAIEEIHLVNKKKA